MSATSINETANEVFSAEEVPFSKKKSASIIEYVETEFRLFEEKAFTVVDSLVLSQMCYMDLKNVVPDAESGAGTVTIQNLYRAERFDEYTSGTLAPKLNRRLLNALCASPRFRDVQVGLFTEVIDKEQEKQFCAMTFFLPTGEAYVCYRGTDTSINGWKEDFNMFFLDTIPGQIDAANYLDMAARKTDCPLYVGGHSKGGNLALFAASFAKKEVQERIITVFNHDGPGLTKGAMAKKEYSDISEKISTTLPHSSIIGLIFCSGRYTVVASKRLGIMQHDPFSWEVENGDFIYEEEVRPGADKLIDSVYELMDTLDREDREIFIDTVFDIIYSAGATTVGEFPAMAIRSHDKVMEALKSIDRETAAKVKSVMTELIRSVAKKSFTLSDNENPKLARALELITGATEKITVRVSGATEIFADKKEKITEKLTESAAKINETTDRLSEMINSGVEKAKELLKQDEESDKENSQPQ